MNLSIRRDMELKENFYYKLTNSEDGKLFYGLNIGGNSFIYNITPGSDRIRRVSVMPGESYRIGLMSCDEWKYVMRVLIGNGYYYEEGSGVHPMRQPKPSHITYFNNIESGESGFGVYLPLLGDNVYMKCFITATRVCYEAMSYNVGKRSDIYFKSVSKGEELKFNRILECYGKQYVYAARKVIPSDQFRAGRGETYYYINDRFTISSKPDTHRGTDTSRFYAGNYFTTLEDAAHVVRDMCEMLSMRQAGAASSQLPERAIDVVSEVYMVDDDIIVRRKKGRPKKSL